MIDTRHFQRATIVTDRREANPSVTTSIPRPLHDELLQVCERKDVRPSAYLRKLIEVALQKEKQTS